MRSYNFFYSFIFLLIIIFLSNCKGDFKVPYPEEKGIVLGKEICQQDVTKDYWLINFEKGYGDTLTYNGVLYNNVVKTNQLDPLLKKKGIRVFLGFTISPNKETSLACAQIPSETYLLRTLELYLQAEQR